MRKTAWASAIAAIALGASLTGVETASASTGYNYCIQWDTASRVGGTVNMYQYVPDLHGATDHSLNEIGVARDVNGAVTDTIELGWQVNPAVTGNSSPDLFVYTTNDAYGAGSGWNASSAMVPVSNPDGYHVNGGVSAGYSAEYGIYYVGGYWYVYYGNVEIGYVPDSAVGNMGANGTVTDTAVWGEVYNSTSVNDTMEGDMYGYYSYNYTTGFNSSSATSPYQMLDQTGTGMECFGGA